jgi:hypothetical protein
MGDTPFNPLDKLNLAESIADALLRQPVKPLPPAEKFDGAGVYAIYYSGELPIYDFLARRNRDDDPSHPIYVGKAVPPGARRGGFGLGLNPGPALLKRLREHAKSVADVENLKVDDFRCRYLVCDDIWIPLGESLLIERFKPPWNVLIDGFGIHTPGKGREKQVRSRWDSIHSGRTLARGLPANPASVATLEKLLSDFFAGQHVETLSASESVIEEDKASAEE